MREVKVVRTEADLDTVMRYFAQGYETAPQELLSVEYAITPGQPRRVWFRLTLAGAQDAEQEEPSHV